MYSDKKECDQALDNYVILGVLIVLWAFDVLFYLQTRGKRTESTTGQLMSSSETKGEMDNSRY